MLFYSFGVLANIGRENNREKNRLHGVQFKLSHERFAFGEPFGVLIPLRFVTYDEMGEMFLASRSLPAVEVTGVSEE